MRAWDGKHRARGQGGSSVAWVLGLGVCDLPAVRNPGNEGGAATVHANSPSELPARLEALAATVLARDALHSQALAALQIVIHVKRTPQGRRVEQIAVVQRSDDNYLRIVPAVIKGEPQPAARELITMLRIKGM